MHPISEILFETYNVLLENGQVRFALGENHKVAVDSVVKTVNSNFFGIERFPTDIDKAAAYLCHLIKRHAFPDGNKRTSLLWFEVWTSSCGLKPIKPSFGYDALAVMIEATDPDRLGRTIEITRALLFGTALSGEE